MALPYKPLSRSSRIALAVGVSFAFHFALLPFAAKEWLLKFPAPQKRMAVSLTGPRGAEKATGLQASRSQTPGQTATAPKSVKPEDQDKDKPKPEEVVVQPAKVDGQIVSLGPPKDERPPTEPTRYLSEHDSRVLKETRARETSAFFKNALSKVQKEGVQQKVEQKPAAAQPMEMPEGLTQAPGQKGGGQIERAQAAQTPRRDRQDRVQLKLDDSGTVKNRTASDALAGQGRKLALARPADPGTASTEGSGPGAPGNLPGAPGGKSPQLKLTLDNPLQSLGPLAGGPMPDHLMKVEEGEETLLNSRSFRYAGYLNRVKETVGRIWVSDVQDVSERRDPTGATFSYKDRTTVVEYTLDKAGEIKEVKVQASSGVDFLDRVAVEAFKKAERFPNPPAGLLGDQGVVTLQFAFTLMSSGGGGPRISVGPAYLPGSPAQRGY
jgi:TonB family protein